MAGTIVVYYIVVIKSSMTVSRENGAKVESRKDIKGAGLLIKHLGIWIPIGGTV